MKRCTLFLQRIESLPAIAAGVSPLVITNLLALPTLIRIMFIPLVSSIVTAKLVSHEGLRTFGISKGKIEDYPLAIVYSFAVDGVWICNH